MEAVHQHCAYNKSALDYDVALLKLKTRIVFDKTMQPIGLSRQDDVVTDGEVLAVSGWGLTKNNNESSSVLRIAQVPKVNREECRKAYAEMIEVTDRMICAGLKEGGKDSCQGDSGGPLTSKNPKSPEQKVLRGVVSWGKGCAEAGYPGVYTNVAAFYDWIHDIAKDDISTFPK